MFDLSSLAGFLTLFVLLATVLWLFSQPTPIAVAPLPNSDLVSITLDGVILLAEPEGFVLNDSFVERMLTKFRGRRLVLIATVADDLEAETVKKLISNSKMAEIVPPHRLILSEKEEGRISIIRQLQPQTHYEPSQAVISALTGKIPQILHS